MKLRAVVEIDLSDVPDTSDKAKEFFELMVGVWSEDPQDRGWKAKVVEWIEAGENT